MFTKKQYEADECSKLLKELDKAGISIQYDLLDEDLYDYGDEPYDVENAPDCCDMLLVPKDFHYSKEISEVVAQEHGCIDERFDFKFDIIEDELLINPKYHDKTAEFYVDTSIEGWAVWLADALRYWAYNGEWRERIAPDKFIPEEKKLKKPKRKK